MKFYFKLILLLTMTLPVSAQSGFKAEQLTFERVKTAYEQKWINLQNDLNTAGITSTFKLYIAAYKSEGKLELWIQTEGQKKYKLFRAYDFCAHSGQLGPKIKEGDLQTPEGFYNIIAFNPKSNFYLSLGINYPNPVDQLRSGKAKPGGDIYIHGNCVTVGCIPLTDDKIKEVYILAVEARNTGQEQIPVHIFPFKMTGENINNYLAGFPQEEELWTNLQSGYNYFEKYRIPPVATLWKGKYSFK
jgi:murein L,D-transpeptidase YafK